MATLLLVDDEEEILKGLKSIILNMRLGFERIDTQSNSEMAERMIRGNRYDIVITDICMDNQTGLEMIESVKEECPECKFIIISGYDDFLYMKDAIRLGVAEYICKPVDKGELKSVLSALLKTIEREKREKSAEYIRRIYANERVPSEGDREAAELQGFYYTAAETFGCPLPEALPEGYVFVSVGENQFVLFGKGKISEKEIAGLCTEGFTACSALNMSLSELTGARKQVALIRNYRPFYEGKGCVFYGRAETLSPNNGVSRSYFDCLKHAILKPQENAGYIHGILETIFSPRLKNCRGSVLIRNKDAVDELFFSAFGGKERFSELSSFSSCGEIVRAYEARLNFSDSSDGNYGIKRALEYIDAHFTENITLAQVSNQVNFNYSYFSRMFKKQVGKSFVQYVTEKRMNLAVQLLSDPEIKIYEIAYKVGYEESKHFTKTFKNYFGVSPDKFRNRTVIKSSNNEK